MYETFSNVKGVKGVENADASKVECLQNIVVTCKTYLGWTYRLNICHNFCVQMYVCHCDKRSYYSYYYKSHELLPVT